MCDGYYVSRNGYRTMLRYKLTPPKQAAWSGKTIQYISDHIGPSLDQRPNIILLHAGKLVEVTRGASAKDMAGTNDMNSNGAATEGNDPSQAAQRLGNLIDKMIDACPDASILVAQIVPTIQTASESSAGQQDRTQVYDSLIPGVVASRAEAGSQILTVDFADFPRSALNNGGVHLTDDGYSLMGDWWYDFIHQIPKDWINPPVGEDPTRPPCDDNSVDLNANGGPDPNIPAPAFPPSIVQPDSPAGVRAAADAAGEGGPASCNANPVWSATGQIALGLGRNQGWHYTQGPWEQAGKLADGIHLGSYPVHLADINNDGKADYLWVDPSTGRLVAWLNNLPGAWSPAGSDGGVIADGAGAGDTVFFADMNGDGFADYLVVDGDTGAVTCYWNFGADNAAVHGWRFVPGGIIATGVPHANLGTLRFPDMNGDGRADYVTIGVGGSLGLWLNTGEQGAQSVLFQAQGGIASGASPDISNVVFADLDGDGRDDYLVWDSDGGLSGFLNQPTEKAGLPFFIDQGGAKAIADGIGQSPSLLRLADLDADGKDDYVYIDTENGALWVWWNRGSAGTAMAADGLRFADIDGDGLDDYIWLDPASGATSAYLNGGPSDSDSLGWSWVPLNGGNPIATGAAPADQVQFGDIDGDGRDDYLVLDPISGALSVWLNGDASPDAVEGWQWNPIGEIASGLGPGANKNIRFADVSTPMHAWRIVTSTRALTPSQIDGDGKDEYIYVHAGGRTTIYRNQFNISTPDADWAPMADADAEGIGRAPEEISFHDVDGDGKADYIWTSAIDGSASVWLNNYPDTPTWLARGEIRPGVGESGQWTHWAMLQDTGRASYVATNPSTGAIAAWLNGCGDRGPPPAPTCANPPVRAGDSVMYLYTLYNAPICNRVGQTQVCSQASFDTDIVSERDWNCDYLGGKPGLGADLFPLVDTPPVITFNTSECEINGPITFERCSDKYAVCGIHDVFCADMSCSSWIATTETGGQAICNTDDLPSNDFLTCGTRRSLQFTGHLSCRGNICI